MTTNAKRIFANMPTQAQPTPNGDGYAACLWQSQANMRGYKHLDVGTADAE